MLRNYSCGKFANHLNAVGVIMAGGYGTRFWPLSQRAKPKQFLCLAGSKKSLIQHTVDRIKDIVPPNGILVSTGETLVAETLRHLPEAVVLAEPVGRNTAPCLGYAAIKVLNEVGDVPMICLPSDHLVDGQENLAQIYAQAAEIARAAEVIVTVGMKPTRPDTGLGYIRRGAKYCVSEVPDAKVFVAAEFREKPRLELAEQYLASGDYYWNGGMFIVRPSVLMAAIKKYAQPLATGLERVREAMLKEDGAAEIKELFGQLPSISIDYAVCEQATNVVVMPGESFAWSDVGSWASWAEYMQARVPAPDGNYSAEGSCFINTENCAVQNDGKFVALVGVKDLVVVNSPQGILVCHRDQTQHVKDVVEFLAQRKRTDLL